MSVIPVSRDELVHQRQRLNSVFLGCFSGFSFLSMFVFGYLLHFLVYRGLQSNFADQLQACSPSKHLYVGGSGIQTRELMLFDMCFEQLLRSWVIIGSLTVIVFSVYIGWKFSRDWHRPVKHLSVPVMMYVVLPFCSRWFLGPRMELTYVALIYLILLFVLRGAFLFNPQFELDVSDDLLEKKLDLTAKMLSQYFLLTIAIIGVVTTQFLFGFVRSIPDAFKQLEPVVPVIAWPYFTDGNRLRLFLGRDCHSCKDQHRECNSDKFRY